MFDWTPLYKEIAGKVLEFEDSIRINDQWRVCFEWPDKLSGPTNVEIVDYH